jgi:UDP-N-acetyl-D-mannosaminuronic acid dehydrogenase
MGLTFKPDIDDLRESPALVVAETLRDEKFNVKAVEPNIESINGLQLVSMEAAVKDADILVFLVRHRQFLSLDVSGKEVLDFCGGILDREPEVKA